MATFTGTAGVDNFVGTDTVADLFKFSPANLAGTDTVVGGLGAVNDTLQLLAPGTVAASQLAGVSGIEFVTMFAGSSIELTANMLATSRLGVITVTGSAGNDTVYADAVTNTAHRVVFNVGSGRDTFLGGAGQDLVNVSVADITSQDFLSGGSNADALVLTTAGILASTALDNVYSFERINLNAGGNALALHQSTVGSTTGGFIVVTGGAGNDTVDASGVALGQINFTAGEGNNTFIGGSGNDTATGGGIADTLLGNGGNDNLNGGFGDNHIEGGTGFDTITNYGGASFVNGGAGADTIQVYTGDSTDTLFYAATTDGGDTVRGDLGHLHGDDIAFQFSTGGFNTLGNNFDHVNIDNGTNGANSDGADLVIYNDGSGPGLGSAAAVDTYFFNTYFAAIGVGAFLLDFNNDNGTATLYYDSNAFSGGTTTLIATLQHLENDSDPVGALNEISDNFFFV